MKKAILISFLLLLVLPVLPQKADTLMQKARLFYQNDEYEMAIPVYRQIIERQPGNFRAYKDLGKCYVKTGQTEKAVNSFRKSLSLKPDYDEAVYGLGNAYDISDRTDSALYWFRVYTRMKPDDPSGFIRMSVIFMDLQGTADSSIYYAQKALNLEPANQSAYYTLAMAYMQDGKYNQSVDAAVKGLGYDSTNYLLYYPWGLSLFFQHNYGLAYQVFTKGVKFETRGTDLVSYRAISLIMKNTPVESYRFDENGQPEFQTFSVHNMDKLDKRIADPLDRYYYPTLLKKFRNEPFTMGLDEFFMFYYGFTSSKEYSPYEMSPDSLDHFLGEGHYKQYIDRAESYLFSDPTQFQVYNTLSMVYKIRDDAGQQFTNLFKYFGFKNAVLASGNGEDADHAFIVTNVNHEYEILRDLGYTPASQEQVVKRNHHFDVLKGKSVDGSVKTLWFNIDKPYKALQELMKKKGARLKR